MKKIIILISIIMILLTGCSNKNILTKSNVNTIIEEDNTDLLISINYPVTHLKKLDQKIQSEIDNIYNNFKKEYRTYNKANSELNIDYTYEVINERYINITLPVFITSSTLAHPINYLITFVFDSKENKFLKIEDLIDKNDISKLNKEIINGLKTKYRDCLILDDIDKVLAKDLMFTFNDSLLTIYFNPYEVTSGYCNIINIDIPISEFNTKISITKKASIETILISKETKTNVIDPSKPVIALTFDDGPSKYTEEIINILKDYNINATFFVLGNKVELYADVIRESIKNGNEIGNHSYNHKQLTKLTPLEIQNQINKTQDIIKNISGYTPKLLRPTYGDINNKIRENTDLKIVLWNIDSLDWKRKNSKTIANSVINKAKDRGIILMHDTKKRTVEAIKIIIPTLLEEGYQFVTISELEEVKLLNPR